MPLAASTTVLSFALLPAQALIELEGFEIGDYGPFASQLGLFMFFAGLAMIIYAMTLGTSEGKFIGGRIFGFGIVMMVVGVAAQYASEATSGAGNVLRTYQLTWRDLILAGLLVSAVIIMRPFFAPQKRTGTTAHDPNARRKRARNTALFVTLIVFFVAGGVAYKARQDASHRVVGLGPIITHEVARSPGVSMELSPEDPLIVTVAKDSRVDVVMLACEMFTEIRGITDHKAVFESVPGRECRVTLGRDGQPYAPVYQGDTVECRRERNGTRCTGGAAQANMAHLFVEATGDASLLLQRRPMDLPLVEYVAKPGSHMFMIETPEGVKYQTSVTSHPNEHVYVVFNLPGEEARSAKELMARYEDTEPLKESGADGEEDPGTDPDGAEEAEGADESETVASDDGSSEPSAPTPGSPAPAEVTATPDPVPATPEEPSSP